MKVEPPANRRTTDIVVGSLEYELRRGKVAARWWKSDEVVEFDAAAFLAHVADLNAMATTLIRDLALEAGGAR